MQRNKQANMKTVLSNRHTDSRQQVDKDKVCQTDKRPNRQTYRQTLS